MISLFLSFVYIKLEITSLNLAGVFKEDFSSKSCTLYCSTPVVGWLWPAARRPPSHALIPPPQQDRRKYCESSSREGNQQLLSWAEQTQLGGN